MSYREEYNKYIKRELNDSFIKDGRTIEYKPHYHSFDEWFDSIWIDTEKEILKFDNNSWNNIKISRIKWNDKAKEDWEMYCKYFDENVLILSSKRGENYLWELFYKEFYRFIGDKSNTGEKTIYKLNESKINSLIKQTKEEYYKYFINEYKDWKKFNEFLKQDVVIWSEDYKNDFEKLKFMRKFIEKYGRSEKVIIDWKEWDKYLSFQYDFIKESHVNIIVIKECLTDKDEIEDLKNNFRNWNIKINYEKNPQWNDGSLKIKEVVLTRK